MGDKWLSPQQKQIMRLQRLGRRDALEEPAVTRTSATGPLMLHAVLHEMRSPLWVLRPALTCRQ